MEENILWGWERFCDQLSSFLRDLDRQSGTANDAYREYAVERLEICIDSVSLLLGQLRARPQSVTDEEARVAALFSVQWAEVLQCLRGLYVEWQRSTDDESHSYSTPLFRSSGRGRPRLIISEQQLTYLRSMSFSWVQIANLFGVSYSTIYRRRQEYGMSDSDSGIITDDELRLVLHRLRQELPSLGQTLVWGRLRSMGFSVTRERVRRTVRESDPLHTALRWRGEMVQRQPYSVPGPNSLWHLDGHHKLIRWRLVTHGCIDGFSRLVVYLHCCTNNRARTVCDQFLKAVQRYGLPSRVRCDQGRENMHVARHMLRHRGVERSSVLVGSSVHNQRIERLWRDMHRCVTSLFYRLFYYLEHNELLDPIDSVHLFALHYVFTPRINQALQQFVEAWNNHGVRTEHGLTPNQLFTSGSLRLRNSGLSALDFFDSVPGTYGVDNDLGVPASDIDEVEGVEVPATELVMSAEQLEELHSTINPLATSDDFGVDIFMQTIELVHSFLP